jgi:hypothetical protein
MTLRSAIFALALLRQERNRNSAIGAVLPRSRRTPDAPRAYLRVIHTLIPTFRMQLVRIANSGIEGSIPFSNNCSQGTGRFE